jgi:hypothetical protein
MHARVVSKPTASSEETPTSKGPAKFYHPRPARRRCARRLHSGLSSTAGSKPVASGLTGSARRGVGAMKLTV